MFKASLAYVKRFISIACLREKVFFARKKYQSLIFAWKMGVK